ncbi:MAG: carbohydrate kinase family protein [Armatimonadota bacterium]
MLQAAAWSEEREFDVLVVGDLNIDVILSGIPKLPDYGEEVLASGIAERLGGSAANFAVCCARLGLRVALVAKVGRDEFGDFLLDELQRWGVSTDYVRRHPDLATGVTVSLSGARDRAFVTYVGTIDSLRGEDIPRELLARCRHLHIASYFLQTLLQADCPRLAAAAHAAGLSISVDTGYDPTERWDSGLLELLRQIDIFPPNEVEAQAITGTTGADAALAALCGMVQVAVVKIGAQGALACLGEHTVHVPAFAVDAVDTTCCGDAFNAGFVQGLLAGLPLPEAVTRGNACGALMASVYGNDAEALSPEAVGRLVRTDLEAG